MSALKSEARPPKHLGDGMAFSWQPLDRDLYAVARQIGGCI